jgi:hypothetical protein
MRDAHEQAIMEVGKTPLGNTAFCKNKRLDEDSAQSGELKANKDFFILSLDGGGLRFLALPSFPARTLFTFLFYQ